MITALLLALTMQQTHAARVTWVPNPRTTNGSWVSDAPSRLSRATVDSLDALITALERETSTEIAVVVVDSLARLDRQQFALALHRLWGVGKAGKDNGLVFLWAPNDRQVFVSIGSGLEGVLPDGRTGRILDREVMPAFRDGQFDAGVLAGVAALAAASREEPQPGGWQPPDDDDGGFPIIPVAGGLMTLGLGGVGSVMAHRRWKRRRPRNCAKCGAPMKLLDEQADDAMLDDGAKSEERIRSIDWDVWACTACDEVLRIPYQRMGSGYRKCPQCQRKTKKVTSTRTIVAATYTSEGRSESDWKCHNCGHSGTTSNTIPRTTPPSSSSSSDSSGGGSSFGGGSAGGGGAGRSY